MVSKSSLRVLLVAATIGLVMSQACPTGQAPDASGACIDVIYIEGCLSYKSRDSCAVCEFNYNLVSGLCDYNPQDKGKCCQSFGADGSCSQCQPGMFLTDGACRQAFLVGCISKQGATCLNCASDFYLKNGQCVKGVEYCASYADNGVCRECKPKYSLVRGRCTPQRIVGCSDQSNDKCNKCFAPFTLAGGNCIIEKCKSVTDYGCSECEPTHYLKSDFACYPRERGCDAYYRGECVSCKHPFKLSKGKCDIEGCSTYNDKSECTRCDSPYTLVDGRCRITNCLESRAGKCIVCNDGFHLHSGECLKPLQNCVDHVAEVCHECAPGYYLGKDNHCRAKDFGCSKYSKGVCVECIAPFVLYNDYCFIDGCDAYDATGCKTCAAPYNLVNKICRLDNCDKAEKGVCLRCSAGYLVRSGKCILKDANCVTYDDAGYCIKCVGGFHTANGNCQKDIEGCDSYNPTGVCTRCLSNYYLTQDNTCNKVAPGCVYRRGSCSECFGPFVYANDGCSIVGCTDYFIDGCNKCQSPFVLTQSKSCSIPFCKIVANGACSACQDDYLLRSDGTCMKKIANCRNYDSKTYTCADCVDGFYVSESRQECKPKVAGCQYTAGKCSNCYKPFVYDNGSCKIVGCSDFDFVGCKQCVVPFQLIGNGVCAIDNCVSLTPSGSGCANCRDGYLPTSNGACSRNIPNCDTYDGDICRACSKGHYLSAAFDKCSEMKPGCIYSAGICNSCKAPFAFKNGGCMIEGCLEYDQLGCVKCVNDKFILYDHVCRLPQCAVIEDNRCKYCAKDYILRGDDCIAVDIYCAKYDDGGICQSCLPGFYLEKNGICKKEKPGSNYINAQVVSCREPFTFNIAAKTCEIDGCSEYFDSGCKVCVKPYKLDYNNCKLDRCVKSKNGKCLKCDQGLIAYKGVCNFADLNCLEYNEAGECQRCVENFMVTPDNVCMKKTPGCIYTGSVCTSCYAPFTYTGSTCQIEGCIKVDYAGCTECTYPYDSQNDKACAIPFCARTANGRCEKCVEGYHAKKGICEVNDPNCNSYSDNGNCNDCVKAYSVLEDGNCHFRDAHCRRFNLMDCLECDDGYYVNVKGTCSVRQKGCATYSKGICVECAPKYYMWDRICRPFKKGCLKYVDNKCVQCEDGYNLRSGYCLSKIAEVTYNDVQLDDEFGSCSNGTDEQFVSRYVSQVMLSPVSVIGKLVYSSVYSQEYTHCQLGYNGTKRGWKALKASASECVGYRVATAQTFYSVEIQSGDVGNYLREFQIEYTLDGNNYRVLPTIYDASLTRTGTSVTINFSPVYAIEIRIIVKTWVGWPNFRFEFFYSDASKIVETSTASTDDTDIAAFIHSAVDTKLDYQVDANIRNFFNPQRDCHGMETCWSGAEFCEPKSVTKLILQEPKENKGHLKQYYMDYSPNGSKYVCFKDCVPIEATEKVYIFDKPILAKSVRVHPVKWTGEPSLKFAFEWK